MLVQTTLNGQNIAYTLKRCKRKSIGLKIDGNGLSISIPLHAAIPNVDSILQEKADWITQKLTHWKSKKDLALTWAENTTYPLLGEPWQIAMQTSGELHMIRQSIKAIHHESDAKLVPDLAPRQIEKFVMTWYHRQAIICFQQRIQFYAQKLNLQPPTFHLSRAKTRWGSCNTRGVIHLNWRLIQMPLHLVDYVVAHELAHLIEMNHSSAFWKQVESVYPDYLMARKELKGYR
ncbi:MAG: M48 family metallopeptidase [Nitrosomonas sp.]|nr:M48 family metallopeptidase [Nitrosomonas sp.]MBP7112764.1 M48 family metallopeptidase [Nitrosomonas sp.]